MYVGKLGVNTKNDKIRISYVNSLTYLIKDSNVEFLIVCFFVYFDSCHKFG
jgi:hypothetical protein